MFEQSRFREKKPSRCFCHSSCWNKGFDEVIKMYSVCRKETEFCNILHHFTHLSDLTHGLSSCSRLMNLHWYKSLPLQKVIITSRTLNYGENMQSGQLSPLASQEGTQLAVLVRADSTHRWVLWDTNTSGASLKPSEGKVRSITHRVISC